MSAARRLVLALLAALAVAGCDLASKAAVVRVLDPGVGFSFLGDLLRVELVRNPGAFLGFGSGWSPSVRGWLFVGSAAALLVALAFLAARGGTAPRTVWCVALLAGGGVGNGIDRALHGTVVDFLNLGIGGLRTGVFNAADLAITLGAVLLLWPARRPRVCETAER